MSSDCSLSHLLNSPKMEVTFSVLKVCRSSYFNARQSLNIVFIFSRLGVSKLLRSNSVRFVQRANMADMFFTFVVLKFSPN